MLYYYNCKLLIYQKIEIFMAFWETLSCCQIRRIFTWCDLNSRIRSNKVQGGKEDEKTWHAHINCCVGVYHCIPCQSELAWICSGYHILYRLSTVRAEGKILSYGSSTVRAPSLPYSMLNIHPGTMFIKGRITVFTVQKWCPSFDRKDRNEKEAHILIHPL